MRHIRCSLTGENNMSMEHDKVQEMIGASSWKEILSRHDMSWSVRPLTWDDGAFLGNGKMGTMVYSEEHRTKRNVLRFILGHTEVTAKRPGGKGWNPRVPIGEFALEAEEWINYGTTMRLGLWDAELTADIITTKGEIKLRSFVHSEKMLLVIEIETSEGERNTQFRWYPYPEVDRVLRNADGFNVNQYIPDTTVERMERNGVLIGIQKYPGLDGCTTAWQEIRLSENRRILYCSVAKGYEEEAISEAVRTVREAVNCKLQELEETHRAWWHEYYQKSFVSFTDTRLEGFYWIQMYKLACATRSQYRIIDNQGPWLAPTPWAGTWFNMNVQMAYSPVYTSNHLEIGESLCRELDRHMENLIKNVPAEYQHDSAGLGRSCSYDLRTDLDKEIGNLTWVCHNYWRQYRHSMDEALLRDRLYPLLRRSINYYLHILEREEDGKLHLPQSISPEYGSFRQLAVRDCHYDLALLRWGCETLLWICDRLKIEDSLIGQWQRVLAELVEFPVNDTGFMIGKDVSLDSGHRHFSHMMAAFPLHLVTAEKEEERKLILKSLRHWIGKEGDLRGFTFTGAASIAALLGRGNEALRYIQTGMELFKPNTMYREAGPVIESPLAAAESINDLLLQSWGGKLRVFPAVPEAWSDITFYHLLAEGAFLVSAVRRGGKTQYIMVESLAGEPCRIVTDLQGELQVAGSRPISWKRQEEGTLEVDIQKGEKILLYSGDTMPEIKFEPVKAEESLCNYFGGNKPWRLYGIPFRNEE